MGVVNFLTTKPPVPTLSYNTGTLYDYLVGRAVIGHDGKWYIDGGLGAFITGFLGKPNQYKSTTLGSFVSRSLGYYKESDSVCFDSERSLTKDLDRIARFSQENVVDISLQMKVFNDDDLNATFVDNTITEICKLKEEHKKDMMVEIPLLDPNTGKLARVYIPTFVIVDSLSYLKTKMSSEIMALGLDDPKILTMYMAEGGQKTILIRKLRDLCESYGIVVVCSAHLDGTIAMNSAIPQAKELQHMKQGEKMKYVGAAFDRLTNNLVQVTGATILKDPSNEPLYGGDGCRSGDLNEVSLLVQRCKSGASGSMLPFVVSQSDGLLSDVTNYHFLRNNDYFGLNGSNQKHQPFLKPDTTISRNTFRDMAGASYELRRAIELSAQWLFIRTFWNTKNMPMDLSMDPKVLFDKLMANKSIKVNDILNTSGVWTYTKKPERPYMSIFDVVELVGKK